MKRTYMLAVAATIVLRPTVYYEVIAENIEDAKKQLTAKDLKEIAVKHRSEFLEEAKLYIEDCGAKFEKTEVIYCGRADQYHHHSECELCTEVYKKKVA